MCGMSMTGFRIHKSILMPKQPETCLIADDQIWDESALRLRYLLGQMLSSVSIYRTFYPVLISLRLNINQLFRTLSFLSYFRFNQPSVNPRDVKNFHYLKSDDKLKLFPLSCNHYQFYLFEIDWKLLENVSNRVSVSWIY